MEYERKVADLHKKMSFFNEKNPAIIFLSHFVKTFMAR